MFKLQWCTPVFILRRWINILIYYLVLPNNGCGYNKKTELNYYNPKLFLILFLYFKIYFSIIHV